jgi:hypothetical protein
MFPLSQGHQSALLHDPTAPDRPPGRLHSRGMVQGPWLLWAGDGAKPSPTQISQEFCALTLDFLFGRLPSAVFTT